MGTKLVEPSTLSYIAPSVMGGEPCVRRSRIPTASIYALPRVRNLSRANIVKLYPGLDIAAVDDAIGLERRLQRAA